MSKFFSYLFISLFLINSSIYTYASEDDPNPMDEVPQHLNESSLYSRAMDMRKCDSYLNLKLRSLRLRTGLFVKNNYGKALIALAVATTIGIPSNTYFRTSTSQRPDGLVGTDSEIYLSDEEINITIEFALDHFDAENAQAYLFEFAKDKIHYLDQPQVDKILIHLKADQSRTIKEMWQKRHEQQPDSETPKQEK